MSFGFSKLGPYSLETNSGEVFLGRDLISKGDKISESIKKSIDCEVRHIAQKALNEVVSLLEDKRRIMDNLANALIEEETIDGKRLLELIKFGSTISDL